MCDNCLLKVCYSDLKHASFIAAKSRVLPQKFLSIYRLELQAAVMSTRLKETIVMDLSIKNGWNLRFLSWISSKIRRYSAFVLHRGSEMLDVTTNYITMAMSSNSENVADQAIRVKEIPIITDVWLSSPEIYYLATRMLACRQEIWEHRWGVLRLDSTNRNDCLDIYSTWNNISMIEMIHSL